MLKSLYSSLLHGFITAYVDDDKRRKVKLTVLALLCVLFIISFLLVLFLIHKRYDLLLLDSGIIFVASILPFWWLKRGKFDRVKYLVGYGFAPFLVLLVSVYGDFEPAPYLIALLLISLYISNNKKEGFRMGLWNTLCFVVYLVLLEGGAVKPMVDFTHYIGMVIVWIKLSGFLINGYLVWNMLSEGSKFEVKLKGSNTKLKELNKDKDKFLSIISHDLRNPFTAILNVLEMLRSEYRELSEEELEELLDVVYDSSKSTYYLLEDLLQWSRSKLGAVELEIEEIEVCDLIQSIMDSMQPQAKAKKIELQCVSEKGIKGHLDRNLTQFILRNYLSNAIKFTPAGGMVELGVQHADKELIFYVSDNGGGIKETQRDKLFNTMTGVSTAGTNKERGTGLGLALCKEFAEKHQGKVNFETELGKGSTFYLRLPVEMAEPADVVLG